MQTIANMFDKLHTYRKGHIMEPHLNTIQKNTIFDSDKIFLKENTDSLENIFKPVEDIDKAIDKIECGHAKNIINIMALCGISMGYDSF